MTTTLLNLIDSNFQNSNLFKCLPIFDAIHYHGHPDGKVQIYKATREGEECALLVLSIIRQDEAILWESAEDLLGRSVVDAALRVQGVFTFDLLTFDFHHEIKTFNYNELAIVIVNHSLKLKPGTQRLIKYSSAYGILQKMVDEPWGKIVFKTAVEVYKNKPEFLYSLLKRMFQLLEYPNAPLIIFINDLSSQPIYDPNNKIQVDRLRQVIDDRYKSAIECLPEVFIQDNNGVRELMSGLELDKG